MMPLVLKLGGELREQPARLRAIASVIAATPSPLVIVHGGGREIDAALAAGTEEVLLIDGREPATIAAALRHTSKAEDGMTRIVTAGSPPRLGATS